jgi:transcriptional regulator with XRE-family HTH domain
MALDIDLRILGSRMCSFRKQRKLTQKVVAERMHIDTKNYSRLERGKQNPSYKMILRYCDAVKVTLKKLMP